MAPQISVLLSLWLHYLGPSLVPGPRWPKAGVLSTHPLPSLLGFLGQSHAKVH